MRYSFGRTWHDAVAALRLLEEAVELPHLVHGALRPAFRRDEGLDFGAYIPCILWIRGKIAQRLRDNLDKACSVQHVVTRERWTGAHERTHRRR